MSKWSKRVLFAVILAGGCYVAYGLYDGYRAGYHTRPDMPDGAFSISYKNGMRARERDKRLFTFLHSSKWWAQFTADIVNPSLRRSSISPSLPGRCSAPTAMKTAP